MRKPRDFDSELQVLTEKAKQLKVRKVQQLGELVIATGADALDVDAAFSHEAAVVEEVVGGGEPVADVETADLVSGALDLLFEIRIPPDVINVGGDADDVGAELVDDVGALADGVHGASAVGIHRVERFDGKFDAELFRVGNAGGDAFGDVFTGLG